LIRLSIWKLVLFYSVLGAIVLTLIRSTRGRNILAFCAVAAGPVLIFALLWFGGDIERYLPLYPAFFVALGSAIETDHSKLIRFLAGTFLILSLISNFFALSSRRLAAQEQAAVDRIAPLLPLLRPSSRVVVVDIHDDLVNFSRSYPFNPINRNAELLNYPLLNPGTPQTKHWREAFAASVAATWNSQADVWISKRLLSPRPMGEWGWIEHGDPNLRWKEVNAFFSQLDYGQDVDGADGFLLLPKTQKNVAVLAPLQTTQ